MAWCKLDFCFLGGLNGLALCLDKICKKDAESLLGKVVGIVVTYCFITFTWIFFRANNFVVAWNYIKGIFTMQDGIVQNFMWSYISIVVILIATVFAVIKSKKNMSTIDGFYPIVSLNSFWGLTAFFISCGLIIALAFTGEAPFVYFQF